MWGTRREARRPRCSPSAPVGEASRTWHLVGAPHTDSWATPRHRDGCEPQTPPPLPGPVGPRGGGAMKNFTLLWCGAPIHACPPRPALHPRQWRPVWEKAAPPAPRGVGGATPDPRPAGRVSALTRKSGRVQPGGTSGWMVTVRRAGHLQKDKGQAAEPGATGRGPAGSGGGRVEAPGWREPGAPQGATHPARQAHWARVPGLEGGTWVHPTWDGVWRRSPPGPLRLPGGSWSPPSPETSPARDRTGRAPSPPGAGPLPRLGHITA